MAGDDRIMPGCVVPAPDGVTLSAPDRVARLLQPKRVRTAANHTPRIAPDLRPEVLTLHPLPSQEVTIATLILFNTLMRVNALRYAPEYRTSPTWIPLASDPKYHGPPLSPATVTLSLVITAEQVDVLHALTTQTTVQRPEALPLSTVPYPKSHAICPTTGLSAAVTLRNPPRRYWNVLEAVPLLYRYHSASPLLPAVC